MSKHSILCSDDANMRSLRQLILMFESSGNITKMVCYDPKPPTVSFVEEVTIDIEDDDRVDNDQQDESEKRQAVQDIEYSVEVSATDPANNVVVEEVTVTASSAPRATGPRPATTADPKKPLSRKRKLFQCPTCDKLLANETFYKEHISLHKAQEWRAKERYICEYCAKESTTKSHHQMHMLIHSDAKPYECGECPARFSRKQGLRRHIMTHTGEKPYVCDHCGASFAAYMSHQLHVRRHTGERPHVCRHCGAKFIGLPSLNVSGERLLGLRVFQMLFCLFYRST